ncbi:MAG: zinc-ribbon domain-containing protein [Longimicrobiaceae bacterium]
MNVQCTSCKTVFRVDPRKVPAGGVRARCSICRAVFDVPAPSEAASAPAAAAQPQPRPTPAPQPAPAPTTQPAPAPAPTPQPAPPPPPPPTETPAPTASRAPSPFGASDPAAKARRLARALISDIVTYFPDRRERALADGTLRREFTEEITKSWQEYTAQVGTDLAKQTPYFREALNDILAKGQQVF